MLSVELLTTNHHCQQDGIPQMLSSTLILVEFIFQLEKR